MAATILRVKRRLEDNPQDALIVTCKRIKTTTQELSPSLFVFRGTVESQEAVHVKEIVPRCDIKDQSSHNVSDIVDKLRKKHKEVSTKSRYEVVNYSRGLKSEETDGEDDFDLVDLQKTEDSEDGVQYAYDLYTAAQEDFDVTTVDNYVSIETELILSSYYDGTHSDKADDDDDSNDENNWRNDYPDSEASSIELEDIIRAMKIMGNDMVGHLSSDDGEDEIYDDEDRQETADLYGSGYAKYKARVLAENPDLAGQSGLIHSSNIKDEDSIDGYKDDDSDDGFYYGQEEDTSQFKGQYEDTKESDSD